MNFASASATSILTKYSRGRIAVLIATIGALAGCGGGGGGGGGGGSGGSSNPPPPAGPAYSLSSTSVSFAANQGDPTPASQQLTVTVTSGTVFIVTAGGGGTSGFLQNFALTGPTTGVVTIAPNPTATPGVFSSQISVRGCAVVDCATGDLVGSPQTIAVTYTVTAAPALSVRPTSLLIKTATGVAPPAQSIDLSIASGNATWTSSVDEIAVVPLPISMVPQTGAFPATVSVNVGPVATAGTYGIGLRFTAGASTAVVPLTLVVTDPKVEFVAPYVATSGRAGAVVIRGHGFTAAGLQVDFGGAPATAKTFVNDTEIRASFPVLPAASYDVHVGNGGAPLPTRAKLVVVDPPGYAAATITRSFANPSAAPVKLIYDDERKSIYLIDNDRNRIEAYRFAAGITPWAADPAPFVGAPAASLGGNNVMAFSPDGTEILKTSQDRLWRVDPATGGSFAQNGAVPVAPVVASSASLNFIAFANDGSAIGNTNDLGGGTSLYRYDMLAQKLAALSTDAVMENRDIFASGDGSTLVIATIEPLNLASLKPVITYDASTGAPTTRASITTGDTHVTMDRAASRMIVVSSKGSSTDQRISVYDHSFNELGKLPAPLQGVVITPDGTKAFAYSAGTGTILKFDLTSAKVGGFFPPVGGGTPVPDTLGAFFLPMTISADGGSLFLAGNQKLVVMPAP